jgi:hypothetical protein
VVALIFIALVAVPGGATSLQKSIDCLRGGNVDITTAGCATSCIATKVGNGYQTTAFFNYGGSLVVGGEHNGTSSPVTLLASAFGPSGINAGGHPGAQQANATLNSNTCQSGFNDSVAIISSNPAVHAAFAPLVFETPAAKECIAELLLQLTLTPTSTPTLTATGTRNGTIGGSDLFVKPIAEGSGLLLLGSMLLAIAGFIRRRFNLVI